MNDNLGEVWEVVRRPVAALAAARSAVVCLPETYMFDALTERLQAVFRGLGRGAS